VENKKTIVWLKACFMIGVIVDGLSLIPMLIPWAAGIIWGFNNFTGIYYFAMGMGASLMLAWTILLCWAYRKPLERRYIALFTIIILIGIIVTEIVSLSQDYIQLSKVLGTLIMQAVLLGLYSYSFSISGTRRDNRLNERS
jgi:hypothetical protein